MWSFAPVEDSFFGCLDSYFRSRALHEPEERRDGRASRNVT